MADDPRSLKVGPPETSDGDPALSNDPSVCPAHSCSHCPSNERVSRRRPFTAREHPPRALLPPCPPDSRARKPAPGCRSFPRPFGTTSARPLRALSPADAPHYTDSAQRAPRGRAFPPRRGQRGDAGLARGRGAGRCGGRSQAASSPSLALSPATARSRAAGCGRPAPGSRPAAEARTARSHRARGDGLGARGPRRARAAGRAGEDAALTHHGSRAYSSILTPARERSRGGGAGPDPEAEVIQRGRQRGWGLALRFRPQPMEARRN